MLYHMEDSWHTPNIQIKHWKSFHQLSYVHYFDVWVPHKFSKKKKKKQTKKNTFLTVFPSVIFYLNIKKKNLFLKQIVMGNEKWML